MKKLLLATTFLILPIQATELMLRTVFQPLHVCNAAGGYDITITEVPFVSAYADPEWRFSAIGKPFIPSTDGSWKNPKDVNLVSLYGIKVGGTYGKTGDLEIKIDASNAKVPDTKPPYSYNLTIDQVTAAAKNCIKLMYPTKTYDKAKLVITVIPPKASLAGVPSLADRPQYEHLKEAYKAHGEDLIVALYWLPETRDVVRKNIPDHQQWIGFEHGLWEKIDETEKLKMLKELGIFLDHMEKPKIKATWERIRDWRSLQSLLAHMAKYGDLGLETFINRAYKDPVLRPVFKPYLAERPADFDAKNTGDSLSSNQLVNLYAKLVKQLLDTPESQRLECLARMFTDIAKIKQK